MSAENEVREASKKLYAALNRMANGDAGSLTEIWSHGAAVTAMHPIGGRRVGWDEVRTSFDQVAGQASDGKIEMGEQLIRVAGDMAYEIGVEEGQFKLAKEPVTIRHRVTNIYLKEGGAWKVIHHHTDTSPAMIDVLHRLQADTAKAGR